MKLFTWGYQSRSLIQLIELCQKNHILTVVDVRRFATSSQPGWGSFSLREELGNAKIEYLHLPALGNYSRGLPWTRLDLSTVGGAVGQVVRKMGAGGVLLLCRERDPEECHRLEVAEEISKLCYCETSHLDVPLKGKEESPQLALFSL